MLVLNREWTSASADSMSGSTRSGNMVVTWSAISMRAARLTQAIGSTAASPSSTPWKSCPLRFSSCYFLMNLPPVVRTKRLDARTSLPLLATKNPRSR